MSKNLSVGIIVDEKCNIQCKHCCFSSGPKSENHLTDVEILSIIDDVLQSQAVTTVGLSGGEAMLRKSLVLECIERVHRAGRKCTLTTNGFWGVTPAKANDVVEELVNAGLNFLTISYDDFHSELLSSNRVRNVINACKQFGLRYAINQAVSRSFDGSRSMSALEDLAEEVPIRRFPVAAVGAAKHLPASDFIRSRVDAAELRCPGFEPTYHFDGNIYPCCTPSIFETTLAVGSIHDSNFEEVLRSMSRNAYFAVIRKEGFGWLHSKAIQFGLCPSDSAVSVIDACELCARLASEPAFLRQIAPELIIRAKALIASEGR